MEHGMPEVILYVASSLDGYIARPDGAVDWLDEVPEQGDGQEDVPADDYGYGEFLAGVDVVMMGRVTYEQLLTFDVDYPYPGTVGYVFSRTRAGEQDENVQFVDGADIPGLICQLKAASDKNIWLIGGGQLVQEFLKLHLIDRIELLILPIILGEGIPLFPPPTTEISLSLVAIRSHGNGMAQLTYGRAFQG